MERYDRYKDSGIEWIGEIPEHWNVKKLKYVLESKNSQRIPISSEIRAKMTNKKYDYYGASGIIDKVDDYLFSEPLILVGEDGANLLTRSSRLAFIAKGFYWVNNHAHILKPKSGNIRYLTELLETIDYSIWISGSAQPKLTSECLMNIGICLPPPNEQTAIAAYLDQKTAEIDALIAKKKRLLELYEEEKTAIINHAVTKGINPNAPMKDSGIDWLGEVPESWIGTKLKFVSEKIGDGIHTTPKYVKNSEYKFVNGNNLDNGSIKYYDSTRSVSKEEYEELKKDIKEGTVLISINGTVGKLAFFANEKVILGKSAAYIEPKADLFNKFLFYIFQTHYVKTQFDLSYSGSTINNLSLYTLHNLDIVLPNKVEQEDIVLHLEADLKEYDNSIIRVKKLIDLLNEYRTTLISEVVTGKNKVT